MKISNQIRLISEKINLISVFHSTPTPPLDAEGETRGMASLLRLLVAPFDGWNAAPSIHLAMAGFKSDFHLFSVGRLFPISNEPDVPCL